MVQVEQEGLVSVASPVGGSGGGVEASSEAVRRLGRGVSRTGFASAARVLAVAGREVLAAFVSPIGYVVLVAFTLLTWVFGGSELLKSGTPADLRQVLANAQTILIFTLPLVTMRLLSEEYRSGSIEGLMTAPVSDFEVILGKFLGTMSFLAVMLATTLIYPVLLLFIAEPMADYGEMAAGYVGLVLSSSMMVAVGVFFSACTRHQLVAALLTSGLLIVWYVFAQFLMREFEAGWVRSVLLYASGFGNFEGFLRGEVGYQPVIFFMSCMCLFLFAATKVLESKRWR